MVCASVFSKKLEWRWKDILNKDVYTAIESSRAGDTSRRSAAYLWDVSIRAWYVSIRATSGSRQSRRLCWGVDSTNSQSFDDWVYTKNQQTVGDLVFCVLGFLSGFGVTRAFGGRIASNAEGEEGDEGKIKE
jgi:hypothetical protein